MTIYRKSIVGQGIATILTAGLVVGCVTTGNSSTAKKRIIK